MALTNVYQKHASSVGKYNQSLYDAMAEENIGKIRMQEIEDRTERYSALLDTAAAGVAYAEEKQRHDEIEEKRKESYDAAQKRDPDHEYMHNKVTFRDWISGEAKLKDVGKDTYHRRSRASGEGDSYVAAGEWSEISGATLDAIHETTKSHEAFDILGLDLEGGQENLYNQLQNPSLPKSFKPNPVGEGSYFGSKKGFDAGDLFGKNSLFSVMRSNRLAKRQKKEKIPWLKRIRKRREQ